MKYTIKQLQTEFPNDDVCLDYIFKQKYQLRGYYKVKGRKCYADSQGKQIHPLKGTVMEKSSTPLTTWFYAIFLFSSSKNGVSAKELERQLGVTYKCAWRIAKSIRDLMKQGDELLGGIVEVDETFFGGKNTMKKKMQNKSIVMGQVERNGRVKAQVIEERATHIVLGNIQKNVDKKATIMSDEFGAYKKLPHLGYTSKRIKHGKKNYVRGDIYTNTIEGFWSQMKRSIDGTYHSVSSQHLQSYVDEFAFRYSYRHAPIHLFRLMLARV